MDEGGFLVVPVLIGFDHTRPIGHLHIRKDQLPPTPDYVFSLGYMGKPETRPDGTVKATEHQLVAVALLMDTDYIGYLRSQGKLPAEVKS